ncbi:hypothetical protein CYLTODRAFT_456025 [Cylindrobasidium torrendii FP15055 ss-10]|uniref:Uncharacterized protein n=1 Tax=Cylindrobasidium torrendii FP15055 ss-10 TaxID=1314674 RepID=A0A0D7B5J6_9AGAR|nr:hypothetical protein CYLTODRAFT_456025 [Cylindrobasidium torrendii FP15055 ss-10]
MRFAALFALIPALAMAAPATPVHDERGVIDPVFCLEDTKYQGIWHGTDPFYAGCYDIIVHCVDTFVAAGTHDPWGTSSCVAAATCWGTRQLSEFLQCKDSTFEPSQAPTLNYANVYAPIVGSCAWQAGGCPITFQNYVDFIYGTITAIGSTNWPSSPDMLRASYWSYVINWTATGDSIPYTNFNDWLFYSNM